MSGSSAVDIIPGVVVHVSPVDASTHAAPSPAVAYTPSASRASPTWLPSSLRALWRADSRWPLLALSCLTVVVSAATAAYYIRRRRLHSSASRRRPPSTPSAPPRPPSPSEVESDSASADPLTSLIPTDEVGLIRAFSVSLSTLQTTANISGELERALYQRLTTPPPPSSETLPSVSPTLCFLSAQWLLLYASLLPGSSLPHVALCWSLLTCIPSPSSSAVELLRLDVAQRLGDAGLMTAAYEALTSMRGGGQMDVEEAVVMFAAAPHLGRWADAVELGDLLHSAHGHRWLAALPASAQQREDVPDLTILYRLAREELERTAALKEKGAEEEKEQPDADPGTVRSEGPTFAPPPLAFVERPLSSCDFRHSTVECSHPELSEHAERIHTAHPPAWTAASTAPALRQMGAVWAMTSPLAPGLRVAGLIGSDGAMRLAGWGQRDEGVGGRVRWSEEYEMRRVGGEDEGKWEGRRLVVRVRRRYAGWSEEDVEVVVKWQWDVHWQLLSTTPR